MNGMTEGLFAITMQACVDRPDGSGSVIMVGHRNHNGIGSVRLTTNHLTVICILPSTWKLSSSTIEIVGIHIANPDNILILDRIDVGGSSISGTYT